MSFFCRPLIVIFFFLSISSFAINPVMVNEYAQYPDIVINDFELNVYDKNFTEKEWWRSQPFVKLNFEGDQLYRSSVETALKDCGFVLGNGQVMELFLQTIEDRFLYVNGSWNGKRFDNMRSLIPLDSDIDLALYRLFSSEFGDTRKKLPKLILLKIAEDIYTDADILYRGPEYYVLRTFENTLNINTSTGDESITLPFDPILFFDLSEKTFSLQIKSVEKVSFLLDDIKYYAPVTLQVESGVHKLEYANETNYLYIIEDMTTELDVAKAASKIKITLDQEAFIRLYKDNILIKSLFAKVIDYETTGAEFRIIVSKEGYNDYDETFLLEPGEYLQKQITLKGMPGTIAFEIDLNGSYDQIILNGYVYVVNGENSSLIIKRKGLETKYLKDKVVSLTSDFVITSDEVYDLNLVSKIKSEIPIINAVNTNRGLWLYLSDKRIRCIDSIRWVDFWIRLIDYLPVHLIKYEDYIAIYDVFSRVVLIDSKYGYNELFMKRLMDITGISDLIKNEDSVSIVTEGSDLKISWYLRSMKTDIYQSTSKSNETLIYRDGWFFQEGERVFQSDSIPVDFVYDEDLCLFITHDCVKAFYLR